MVVEKVIFTAASSSPSINHRRAYRISMKFVKFLTVTLGDVLVTGGDCSCGWHGPILTSSAVVKACARLAEIEAW